MAPRRAPPRKRPGGSRHDPPGREPRGIAFPWARSILPAGAVVLDVVGSDHGQSASACARDASAATGPHGPTNSAARTRTVCARSGAGARASGSSAGDGGPRFGRNAAWLSGRVGRVSAHRRTTAPRVATQVKHAATDPSAIERGASSRQRRRCEPSAVTAVGSAVRSCAASATASASGGCAVLCADVRESANWTCVSAAPRSPRRNRAGSAIRA